MGREGSLKTAHLKSAVSCTHLTPASFPSGIPGMGELIEGYMQQAPQSDRHSMVEQGLSKGADIKGSV